jgi:hypothetical protein
MEAKATQIFNNIVTLDIRTATQDSIAHIKRIDNVVTLICAPQTADLVAQLHINNIVQLFEAAADARFSRGRLVLSRDTFKDQAKPLDILAMGKVIVNPDVSTEDIEQGLGDLVVCGQILYPEHLAGAIQSKLRRSEGSAYPYSPRARLIMGQLTLDEVHLNALDDGSELMVVGKLHAPHVLPNDLLEQKIQKIQATGGVLCREENAPILMKRLQSRPAAPKVTVIPAGFELVERALVLDSEMLKVLPSRQLYCKELVRIAEDVAPDALDEALQALVIKDMLVCPAALRSVVTKKFNVLETEVVFYAGELWFVDDDASLSAARFDYLEDKASLVVTGALSIAADVDPKLLAGRLDRVYNYGVVTGTPAQIMALQARLGTNKGEFMDETDEPAEKDRHINNVVYLKL